MNNNYRERIKELFLANYPRLKFHARSILGNTHDAEDVVEEVFFELWNKRETIDLEHGISTYLYKAVTHRALNMLRRREVSRQYFESISEINDMRAEFIAGADDSATPIEQAQLAANINKAISGLSDKCRQAFILSYLHGMKNAEIAEIMQVSVRTVDAHIYRALRILREQLKYLLSLIFLFNLY